MKELKLLKEQLKTYIDDKTSLKLINEAITIASSEYNNIKLLDKIDFLDFIFKVVYALSNIQTEPNTIISALIYKLDTSKDEFIKEKFSKEVFEMVIALRKIDNIKELTNHEIDNENFRKIFVALAKDYKVIVIRLLMQEVLMEQLSDFPGDLKRNLAKETIDVYAPLAHRLGMFQLKSNLENKALFHLDNEMYLFIQKSLKQKEEERMAAIVDMQKELTNLLNENNIEFYSIKGRPKQIYSIYNKMKKKNLNFNQLYDLLALRIITKTEVNCYEVLGYIHTVYKPVQGKFKDYIAVPKPNMYQSLHTSVVARDNNIYEIQIRTKEMDEVAEKGVAAHWKYKEGSKVSAQKQIEEQLHWFRDFVSINELKKDEAEQIENLKRDIFEADIYVMSPRGKVVDLPKGSTPVDFAYRIHSNVGHSCVGALVNNVMVPLSKELKTGDVVVIKTSKHHTLPSKNWLQFVKTSLAKNHIKKALLKKDKEEQRDQMIERGKELINEEIKNKKLNKKEALTVLEDSEFLKQYGSQKLEELYINVANRMVSAINVVDKIKTKLGINKETPFEFRKKVISKTSNVGIVVEGIDSVKVTLAKCCSPIPGDEIVGFVSRGRGVRVHRVSCSTIDKEMDRLIDVQWIDELEKDLLHQVDIKIMASERNNLLVEIMNTLSQLKIKTVELKVLSHRETLTASFDLSLMVKDNKQLNTVVNSIKNLKGVYEIERVIRN